MFDFNNLKNTIFSMAYFIFLSLVLTIISQLGSSSSELNPSVDLVPGKTTWSNNDDSNLQTVYFSDGSIARFILLNRIKLDTDSGFGYGFGFYCTSSESNSCYISILFVEISNNTILDKNQYAVWSCNRDNPVRENATLKLDFLGNLILYDVARGGLVWSTETSGSSISKMRIFDDGNLILMDSNGVRVWQSFKHLTDTLLSGQVIAKDQSLTSRVEPNNLSSGLFSLVFDQRSLSFYEQNLTNYMSFEPNSSEIRGRDLESVEFRNGNVSFYYSGFRVSLTDINSSDVQIMKLDSDGGLRIHGWSLGRNWRKIYVFLPQGQDECRFPLKCGTYGLCDKGSKCSCPVSTDNVRHFNFKDSLRPELGCLDTQVTSGQFQFQLVSFGHISYFSFFDERRAVAGLEDEDSCIKACGNDSLCMAAFFKFDMSTKKGFCFLIEEVLSLMLSPISNISYPSLHLRVRIESKEPQALNSHKPKPDLGLILVVCFTSLFVALVLVVLFVWIWRKTKRGYEDWYKQGLFEPEILIKRFSYRELYTSTSRFSEKLGRGGFGSVFKGVLRDGRAIAVKKLETKQGAKEFLAEIDTLGNIHHINLVRLFGFCVDRKNRMLVYEYMSKGSLDKWIFDRNKVIPWGTRKKIILDIAKGLTYLHEECRYKIAHLDVKPHNVLIDDNFNAKLSDFGLSKLISRDESQVLTGARGTLGYWAPEWQNSVITVKADVYSFGIVLLEIVCGRKILDHSQPDSDVHLRTLLGNKARERKLKEMVDIRIEDMRDKSEEAVEMMKLGMWCSEDDYNKRPSMSTVVKILEGGFKNQI